MSSGGARLEQAQQAHRDFAEQLALLGAVPKVVSDPDSLREDLHRVRGFLGSLLPRHFRLEEDSLFPAALGQALAEQRPRLERRITSLLRDHDALRAMAAGLLDSMALLSQAAAISDLARLNLKAQEFSEALRLHARQEEEEIFPLLLQIH